MSSFRQLRRPSPRIADGTRRGRYERHAAPNVDQTLPGMYGAEPRQQPGLRPATRNCDDVAKFKTRAMSRHRVPGDPGETIEDEPGVGDGIITLVRVLIW